MQLMCISQVPETDIESVTDLPKLDTLPDPDLAKIKVQI